HVQHNVLECCKTRPTCNIASPVYHYQYIIKLPIHRIGSFTLTTNIIIYNNLFYFSSKIRFILSRLSLTCFSGFFFNDLTPVVITTLVKKPWIISYSSKIPPCPFIIIQNNTTIDDVTIPAIAPFLLKPFQYNDINTRGPNAAPKPAQALPTKFKIVSFGVHANIIATIATSNTAKRPINTNSLSLSASLPLFLVIIL